MDSDYDELERQLQREIGRLADECRGTFSQETMERSASEAAVS